MKPEREYDQDATFAADFGGPDALRRLLAWAETLEASRCPHCGGAALLGLASVYGRPGARVICGRCKCQTMLFVSGAQAHFDDRGRFSWEPVPIEDCITDALARWNRRRGRKKTP